MCLSPTGQGILIFSLWFLSSGILLFLLWKFVSNKKKNNPKFMVKNAYWVVTLFCLILIGTLIFNIQMIIWMQDHTSLFC
mgnify:CR=1 FL=1